MMLLKSGLSVPVRSPPCLKTLAWIRTRLIPDMLNLSYSRLYLTTNFHLAVPHRSNKTCLRSIRRLMRLLSATQLRTLSRIWVTSNPWLPKSPLLESRSMICQRLNLIRWNSLTKTRPSCWCSQRCRELWAQVQVQMQMQMKLCRVKSRRWLSQLPIVSSLRRAKAYRVLTCSIVRLKHNQWVTLSTTTSLGTYKQAFWTTSGCLRMTLFISC